jgi:hypothetical protein
VLEAGSAPGSTCFGKLRLALSVHEVERGGKETARQLKSYAWYLGESDSQVPRGGLGKNG